MHKSFAQMGVRTPIAQPVDIELDDDEYLISRTDAEGKMNYVNAAFVTRSGYSLGELLGQPASMLYAPDTPSDVGSDLWRTVKTRGAWAGVMRHRCKDGRYFWAKATITRTIVDGVHVGHTTVRTKADASEVAEMRRFTAQRANNGLVFHTLFEGRLTLRGIGRYLHFATAPTLGSRLVAAQLVNAAFFAVSVAQLFRANDRVPLLPYMAVALSVSLALILALATSRVRKPINRMLAHARSIGAGDLTQSASFGSKARDEIATLSSSMDVMQKSLASLVNDLRNGVRTVDVAASEISDANMALAARTEETAGAVEQTAARISDLNSAVRRNADHAGEAHRLATSSMAAAERGRLDVLQVIQNMDDISSSSSSIADISLVIESIAFQTNILALNAAVEAARAGGHGRGFAVVASEVRNLAQRSSDAVRQIKQLLDSSARNVGNGVRVANSAGSSMEEIVRLVERVVATVGEISEASDYQRREIEQINEVIGQIDDTVRQNAAMVEQAASAASALAEQSQRLDQSVSMFRTKL